MSKMYSRAIVRRPGRNFAGGITTSGLGIPDYEKALLQHDAYCEALVICGLEVTVLDADERYPDGCFVEDTAVVNDRIAVITRPGALSRRGEEEATAQVLSLHRVTVPIEAPGTLEGGDVLRIGSRYFVGLSGRTNSEGARQFADIMSRYGFETSEIEVRDGLHLKSDIGYPGDGIIIATPLMAGLIQAKGVITLQADEYYSANCLRVNDYLLIPKGFPKAKRELAVRVELTTCRLRGGCSTSELRQLEHSGKGIQWRPGNPRG